MNKKIKLVSVMVALTLIIGCATPGKSILLGSAVGAGMGAGLGNLASQNEQGTLVGAATGAVVGGLVGYLGYKGKSKGEPTITPGPKDKPDLPFLTRPEVRSIWVPDKIEGNQYIRGHYIYIIEKQSGWSR